MAKKKKRKTKKRGPKKINRPGKKKAAKKKSKKKKAKKKSAKKQEQLSLDVAPSPRSVDPIALAEAREVRDKIAPKLRKGAPLTTRQKLIWRRVNARENDRRRDEGTRAAGESYIIALTGETSEDLKGYVAAGMPEPTKRHGKESIYDGFATVAYIVEYLKKTGALLSPDRFAESMGVSLRSLTNWENDHGMPPPVRRGRGRSKVVLYGPKHARWIIAHYDKLRTSKHQDAGDVEWETRLKKARALKAERDLAESEDRLVSRDDIEEDVAEAVRAVRARLEVLGDRVAPLCADQEARAIASIVDREISIILEEFSRAVTRDATESHHGDTENTEDDVPELDGNGDDSRGREDTGEGSR